MTDTPNPFDDNSVQQVNAFDSGAYGDAYEVNTGPPAFDNNKYDDSGAYGASSGSDPPQQFGDPNDVQQSTGYNTSNMQSMEVQQSNVPDDELERTCWGYSPGMLWMWSVACAALLCFAGIFDLFLGSAPGLLQIIVDCYLICIGAVLMFVELPANFINQSTQMRAYKWARMLRRAWGKAFIYSFFAFLTCTDSASAKVGCGVCVIIVSIGIWFIGWQTARIMKRMVDRIVAGTELGTEDFDIVLERKFRQLNNNAAKKELTKEHIFNLGKECGFWLNSTEVWLIFMFWDDNADGTIDLIEWKYGFKQIMTGSRYCKFL